MGFLFIAAEIEKLVAQPHQRFPLFLEQRLDLRHILRDIAAKDVAASHGGKPRQKVVCGQGDVGGLVDQQMDRHRQPALVFPVCYKVQGLDELSVNHAYKVIEGFIAVGNTAEQGHLFLAHFLQMEIVGIGQPCNLRQVEGRQPNAHTNQDTLECFARPHLKDMVLLHGDALRVPHFKPCEQDVQRRLVFLIFLPHLGSSQHFHHHSEVLFFRRRFVHEVQNQCLQKRGFGFLPERIGALCSGRGGGLDESFDQAQHVLIVPHIGQGVVAEGGVGV